MSKVKNPRHWHVIISLLKGQPHAIGAEIGIFKGRFCNRLLKNLPGIKKYYCIDPWEHDSAYKKTLRAKSNENKSSLQHAFKTFTNSTDKWKHKRIILRMTSMEALEHVPDNHLDWVFIDGNHSYEYAKPDIIGWSKKVKVGGLISGHDFFDNAAVHRKVPFGVAKAVKELVPKFETQRGPNVWYAWKESENWIRS